MAAKTAQKPQKQTKPKNGQPSKSGSPLFSKNSSKSEEELASERAAAARNRHGLYILFRKELSDHLHSVRFQILYALLAVVSFLALYGAVNTISEGDLSSSECLFLLLYTTSGDSIYSFATFIGFLGPIIGIMLGFDAINEEVAQGTLNRLAAQPIYRDAIINAKFLAGTAAVAITVYSIGGLVGAVGMLVTGLVPSTEEVLRLILFLLVAVLYICMWMALAELFSVVCKHAATAALACVAIWIFLTLFMSLVADGLASLVYPLDGMNAVANVFKYYSLDVALNRISPYYLFSEITTILMNPNVHSTNIISILQSSSGAIASYLTLGQSLLQIWPHIVAMLAVTVAIFAAAYIVFMKREIRA